ncbi:neuropeptide SIFamide receptor-like [Anopheles arabiensis]|uniref:G-protein coupled receptors family 1 profile domain-containing protein n=1 Tax=Anopheles arabiensis TaxID=7173 RepID=A0A182HKQ1_ANOAR|nr:neuropeptide SIFamide receptor-like [Anopheles arabiensis]XP_040171402.1 neuropeptide SIFamide receptor-like [Anopheles arabiensis]
MSPPDDSTETEPPSAMSTTVVTVATLLAERCLGCAINYTGAAAAAANPPGERLQSDFGRPTTPAPRHNWTWSYLNLSAPQQYDTFDGEYEIDPAYQLRYSVLGTVLLTVAYALVFILGLLGNISVVIVVKKSTMMRSPTNRFIVNLAYADLLVNFLCLPFTLIGNLYPAWILGVFFCKGVSYLQGVSVSASVNTLMAISIERCFAISFPISGTITTRQYRLIVTIIWFIALSINLPWLFVFTLRPIGIPGSIAQICTELWPTPASESWYFLFANLFFCYLGPLIVISICYVIIWKNVAYRNLPREMIINRKNDVFNRSKVKVIKMVFVVIITFAISWLPLYAIFCFVKFAGDLVYDETVQSFILNILPVAQWLGASNSCINPILYAFMNRKFRAGFKKLFHSCCTADEDDWDLPTTVGRLEEKDLYLRRVRSFSNGKQHQTLLHYTGREHCSTLRVPLTAPPLNVPNGGTHD